MNHILLFESFVNSLHEIAFTDHWLERSASGSEDLKKSRIVYYQAGSTDLGYSIEGFLPNGGQIISKEDFIEKYNIDEGDVISLITYALKKITRSKRLENWQSTKDKEYILLNLGRICFYLGENEKYYVVLKAKADPIKDKETGKEKSYLDYHTPGNTIYGYSIDNDGITFKFYPNTYKYEMEAAEALRKDRREKNFDFYKKFDIDFPYGKDFQVLVDLTDIMETEKGHQLNLYNIKQKIDKQFRGEEIKLGPEEKIENPEVKKIMTIHPIRG